LGSSLQEHTDISGYYAFLCKHKFDICSLTIPQTLRRDYKQFEFPYATGSGHITVGISSVLLLERSVDELYTLTKWRTECEGFRQRHQLDALAVMYAAESATGFVRQLGVVCDAAVFSFFELFARSTAGESEVGLLLDHCDVVESTYHAMFTQRDAAVSRKTLTPLMAAFFFTQQTKASL
jgi:exopolyphosphatase